MKDHTLTFEGFQRWRRPFEVGFWIVLYTCNASFNSIDAQVDHPQTAAWEPWCWEWSSAVLMLALVPAVVWLQGRWPIRLDNWRRALPRHLAATIPFSVAHVAGMIALRKLAYAIAGSHYDFGAWWVHFGYEYLKDARTYFSILATIALYRLWLIRWQGEASLLAEPDEGPPVEPVDCPERFLVRKLGKEFLIAAREIEWLQASGNYVNLHVRGRDYPLRTTLGGIEGRLDPQRFVRVHRSYLVNLDYLVEITPLDTGEAHLGMRDGGILPCSRRFRGRLRERFSDVAADTSHPSRPDN
jgi:hypothetical protein